jgi:hypothetical protein
VQQPAARLRIVKSGAPRWGQSGDGTSPTQALDSVVLRRHGGRTTPILTLVENAMVKKSELRAALFATCVMLAAAWGSAGAQEVPLVTGEIWTTSSDQMKKAYLVGIANAIQVEAAYEGTNPPSDAQSIVPRLAKGLKGQTLDSVRVGLDKWYAANPGRLQRPVIETIWFEFVVPGLQKAN